MAISSPTRKFRLDVGKYPKATIMTDASPLGAGAVLLINGRLMKGYATKITNRDARLLGFEEAWEKSSSQGIAETFSILPPATWNCKYNLIAWWRWPHPSGWHPRIRP